MASKVLMRPNIPSMNHVAYSGSMVPRSHSSGQLCLPKKRADTTAFRSQSHVSSFITPAMSTGLAKTSSSTSSSRVLLNENLRVFGGTYEFPWSCSCYEHVGVEIALDFFNMQNPSCVHDLGSYISLLKCLKRDQVQKDEENLFNRARESILSRAQNINMEPLKNAASNVVNLVQSQRTEFLKDDTILGLMNSFALYILL
ncbi:hypothetical protein H0E87_005644 [Populus deltoides]|uniref:Uncharacterized protein n=1 Tax=Populus deltoides TaxID=3696 RepID=A0A8T2ZJN8_POPDE|nr:hypothetical protein H0E87_005644 [Populus deltoides]